MEGVAPLRDVYAELASALLPVRAKLAVYNIKTDEDICITSRNYHRWQISYE